MAGIKEKIFRVTPLSVKGWLLGVHSLVQSSGKYGRFYASEIAALRARALLPRLGAENAQRELLGKFLAEVQATNGHYRAEMQRKGIENALIKADPVKALLLLDILEKKFLKKNIKDISSSQVDTYKVSNTSGTSGSPMQVPYDGRGHQRGFAYWRRFYDEMGLGRRFRNTRFSGRILLDESSSSDRFWVHDWYERRLFMSTYHLTPENLPAYIKKLNDYKPELIDGYPSAISTIARFIVETKANLTFTPVAIATTAETLFERDRQLIERAFGCKVHNQYASSEGAPFITECRERKLHLNLDTGYFEFHKLRGTEDLHELVVTSFRNLKVPLIRYRIGDTVRLHKEQSSCACGSPFPTIENIEGRTDDILYSSERGSIGRLDPIFKGVEGIEYSQIIQEDIDCFRILVVPGLNYSTATADCLTMNFKERAGASIQLNIELVESIPSSSNGKFKSVVNRVNVKDRVVSE